MPPPFSPHFFKNISLHSKYYSDYLSHLCIKESRVRFLDPMLITLDTQHGPITKVFGKMPEISGKNEVDIVVSQYNDLHQLLHFKKNWNFIYCPLTVTFFQWNPLYTKLWFRQQTKWNISLEFNTFSIRLIDTIHYYLTTTKKWKNFKELWKNG